MFLIYDVVDEVDYLEYIIFFGLVLFVTCYLLFCLFMVLFDFSCCLIGSFNTFG